MSLRNSPNVEGAGPFAAENPIRRPEKHPAGGLSVITVGRYSAMRSIRSVAPRRFLAPPGCFSVYRLRGLLLGFSSRAGPSPCHDLREFPRHRRRKRDGTLLRKANHSSGRSRASDGKRQRERQKSRQVTDLPFRRQAAAAAVSPAVSQFAAWFQTTQVGFPSQHSPMLRSR